MAARSRGRRGAGPRAGLCLCRKTDIIVYWFRPGSDTGVLTVIDRYLNREILLAWLGVTGTLLLIIMSHRFAGYLGDAASGDIPPEAVGSLVALSAINYLVILIPVGFFLAILLALGRLYRDSEMAALMAVGVGPTRLYGGMAWLALPMVVLVAWLSLWLAPQAAEAANQVQERAEQEARLGVFEPGAFRPLEGGEGVFYAAGRSGEWLEEVFIQGDEAGEQVVIRAERARVERREGERYLVLEDGRRHEFVAGEAEMQRTRFQRHGIRLPGDPETAPAEDRETRSTLALMASEDPADQAQLHWRLAMPVGTLVLALLAVPLARSSPREGRYARLFAGILVYLVYSNLLTAGQVWLESGRMPAVAGLWWVHALFVALTGLLLARQGGYLPRPPRIRWRRARA